MAKTACEKLNVEKQPKVVQHLPAGCKWAPPGSSMIVSTPLEVDGVMKSVRKGKLTTIAEIRACLAQRKLLQGEGFSVEKKGKSKYIVSDYERFLTPPATLARG